MTSNIISTLIRVSRPRFRHYVAGPWLVGYTASLSDIMTFGQHWRFRVFLLYFTLPANLLIYGVNDIADGDTDQYNPKKGDYEAKVGQSFHRVLMRTILVLNIPFWLISYQLGMDAMLALGGFVFFSVAYSLPPIRAKAIPFLDGITNVLYVLPGVAAYLTVSDSVSLPVLIASTLWVMAMHCYSAIPDIDADTRAGLSTSATVLGKQGAFWYCMALYSLAAILVFPYLGPVSIIAGAIYIVMIRIAQEFDDSFGVYQYFPLINLAVGFMVYIWLVTGSW